MSVCLGAWSEYSCTGSLEREIQRDVLRTRESVAIILET